MQLTEFLVIIGFGLVGTSSWITINGLYVELSAMVYALPESWSIGTDIALVIQLANISVLAYACIPDRHKTQRFVINTTYTILAVSCFSMVVMAFTWDSTAVIFGERHSVWLILTAFGTALCDCMTSMVFWVFVSWYPTQYVSILAAGEAASGIVASLLVWAQQLGTDKPRFSVTVYLFLLAMVLPSSGIAFHLLLRYKSHIPDVATSVVPLSASENRNEPALSMVISLADNTRGDYAADQEQEVERNEAQRSIGYFTKYLVILAVLSGLQNGMMPSIATYALFPYSRSVYVAATTISNCVNPIVASMPSYLNHYFVNDPMIHMSVVVWSLCAVYILVIALCSPHPWGSGEDSSVIGSVVVVSVYVVWAASTTCCKSCCITLIKQQVQHNEKKTKASQDEVVGSAEVKAASEEEAWMNRVMETVGKVIQAGSFTVSVVFFLLVHYAGIFTE